MLDLDEDDMVADDEPLAGAPAAPPPSPPPSPIADAAGDAGQRTGFILQQD